MPPNDETTNTATDVDATEVSPATLPARLEQGTKLGRYEIGEVIGAGGMGVVYRARDPELKRDVAIKVVAARPGRSQDRLLAEARAMAKVDHPAVMPVFDVGAIDDGIYVVMPYLAGGTLHDWIHAEARPWRAVLQRFLKAGRGLAAAHAAGLVHRDFKPKNVMLDGDDVLVADFGLVIRETGTSPESANSGASTIGGTSGYMAPEQAEGGAVDARADQFSFCVSLWEGLTGQRPQQAMTRTSGLFMSRAVPDVPADRSVPAWLSAAVARGFSPAPDRRWRSLGALIKHIENRRRRGRRMLVGAFLLAGAAAAMIATRPVAHDRCPAQAARVRDAWNPSIKAAIASAFSNTKLPYAVRQSELVIADLDRHADKWTAATLDTCRASRSALADTRRDLRRACLDRWLIELEATGRLLGRVTDASSLEAATAAAGAISHPEECLDERRLGNLVAPPPEKRVAANEIEAEAVRLGVSIAGHDVAGLPTNVASLVARARELGHVPALARALRIQASLLIELNKNADARMVLLELADVSAKAGDDVSTAFAWIELIEVLYRLDRYADAKNTLPAAKAAVARAGNRIEQEVSLLHNEAMLIDGLGEADRSLKLLEHARDILLAAGAEQADGDLADQLLRISIAVGAAQGSAADYAASIATFKSAIKSATRRLGTDHPQVAHLYYDLSETQQRANDLEDALESARTSARIARATVGESGTLVRFENQVARILTKLHRNEESLAQYAKAYDLATQVFEKSDPVLLKMRVDYAFVLRNVGRHAEALALLDQAASYYEASGQNPGALSNVLHNRGGTLREMKRYDESIRDFRRAIELIDTTKGNDRHAVSSLAGLGLSYLEAGRPLEAIAPLERASKDETKGRSEYLQRIARWLLGRARVEAKTDVARGLAEVRAARGPMVAAGDLEEVKELDSWLAKHERGSRAK